MNTANSKQVIFTLTARCRDCYRCVRHCPVKAIRMHQGQAYVEEGLCIGCGTCIRECPQKAKAFRNDIDIAQDLVDGPDPVAASVAPSFAGVLPQWQRDRLASALRSLGFRHVAGTSRAAHAVALAAAEGSRNRKGPCVCTACPAVVSYVEKHRPQALGALIPVVSPMVAHAMMLKHRLGTRTKVVFIGPCVAKKTEAQRPQFQGLVDAVLTFQELLEWMERRGVAFSACEESGFDDEGEGDSRYFALPGGLLKAANLDTTGMGLEIMQVSGHEEVREAITDAQAQGSFSLVEPLFCPGGCLNGPGAACADNIFTRKKRLLQYAASCQAKEPGTAVEVDLHAGFAASGAGMAEAGDAQIAQVLASTGKFCAEDELNCGACGYGSCREKAQAVVRGMAEVSMCIPYMRRLAERRTDRIIETSPNAIVILDEGLRVLSMNPSFRRFFVCSDGVVGKHISYLMDPAPFEKLAAGGAEQLENTVHHASYNLVCRQQVYALREEKQFVGIFVDVTRFYGNQAELNRVKAQTVAQAKDLLQHQVSMAQKMAQFLGESTARSEELIAKLVEAQEAEQ